ncbi:MAG TPA: hypothetical protein IAB15_03865 [Candidatus Ornithoclostridium faecigallinarum]|nr:hypothetical protein [Candidatus Ornithoclostridium faecigallinarum]
MMISRHALAAIAIPSLRSLQIWVVPPKQTPQIEEFVFCQYNMDAPVTRLRRNTEISRRSLTAIIVSASGAYRFAGNSAQAKVDEKAAAFCILFIRLAVVNTFFKQGGIADGKDNFG